MKIPNCFSILHNLLHSVLFRTYRIFSFSSLNAFNLVIFASTQWSQTVVIRETCTITCKKNLFAYELCYFSLSSILLAC